MRSTDTCLKSEGIVQPRRRERRYLAFALGLLALFAASPAAAQSHAYLLFDVKTGEVLARSNAHRAWYPASVTKLMTTYVAFKAIRAGRLTLTSPVVMTPEAAAQPPSKMGFPVGTVLTVDNALKIIMVKSANDVAWALGDAIAGSEPAFVAEMNDEARRLGMINTTWGNPNGLPDPSQVTNAHDLALLARALIREFPDYEGYFRLPAVQFGKRRIANHNHLLTRFPGTTGMKTGFICASGFNVVASATRDGRQLVAIVLGSPNPLVRAEKAAELFTKGFEGGSLLDGLFGGAKDTIDSMRPGPEAALPPDDIRDEVCGRKRKAPVQEDSEDSTTASNQPRDGGAVTFAGKVPSRVAGSYLAAQFDIGPAVKVWTGGADASLPSRNASTVASASGQVLSMLPGAPDPKPSLVVGAVPNNAPAQSVSKPQAPGSIYPGTQRTAAAPLVMPQQPQSFVSTTFGLFSTTPPGSVGQNAPVPARANPPTGPEAGAGVLESLAPTNGAPMVITVTRADPATAAQPREASAVATLPMPRPKPTGLAAASKRLPKPN